MLRLFIAGPSPQVFRRMIADSQHRRDLCEKLEIAEPDLALVPRPSIQGLLDTSPTASVSVSQRGERHLTCLVYLQRER